VWEYLFFHIIINRICYWQKVRDPISTNKVGVVFHFVIPPIWEA
jgi:hypothetical protein